MTEREYILTWNFRSLRTVCHQLRTLLYCPEIPSDTRTKLVTTIEQWSGRVAKELDQYRRKTKRGPHSVTEQETEEWEEANGWGPD